MAVRGRLHVIGVGQPDAQRPAKNLKPLVRAVICVESMNLIPAFNGYPLMNGSYIAVSITDNGQGAGLGLSQVYGPRLNG